MQMKDILDFVKIEHTLFSLPFVLMGFVLADRQFGTERTDLLWIIVAAIGARGLAMALNRLVDREIDADNPRTASRHLPSGKMTALEAWALSGLFLVMLLVSAWRLNEVALKMAWLPVLAFVVYPYTKRFSWLCHFWIGLCLALAPAGAWVAISADTHGWEAITGVIQHTGGERVLLWYPEIFYISFGVALWITAFDINYALMDVEVDRKQGIKSFPARFGAEATRNLSVLLTLGWCVCFCLTGLQGFGDSREYRYFLWIPAVIVMGALNIYVMAKESKNSDQTEVAMERFQQILFRCSMLTGWALLGSLLVMQVQ